MCNDSFFQIYFAFDAVSSLATSLSNLTISNQLKHISKCDKFFFKYRKYLFFRVNTDFCVNAIILYCVMSEIFI